MIVSWSNLKEVVAKLSAPGRRSVDCEATGLRVHHQDHLFSIIIGDAGEEYYFDFNNYAATSCEVDEETLLSRDLIPLLKPIFDQPLTTWDLMNAKYDMHLLAREGIFIQGTIHCVRSGALLEYNEHFSYSLDAISERLVDVLGEKKSDAVDKYITEHKLSEKISVPGKAKRETLKFFNRVPAQIIRPYGCADARITRKVGIYQEGVIDEQSKATPAGLPTVRQVLENERRFTKTAFRMERNGVRIDREFCVRAAQRELERSRELAATFKRETGREYLASSKLFADIFASDRERWENTKKGNPSFKSKIIERFENPVAKTVVAIRSSKANADFLNGFLWHADKDDFVHPNLNQDGAGHGRTSSSEPNFQNLKKKHDDFEDDDEEAGEIEPLVVRRAIIPPPGLILVAMDMDQMEYKFLMDRAEEMEIIHKIRVEGLDVHTATAQMAGGLNRDDAKRVNFGLIYGQGLDLLAYNLKVTRQEAARIKYAVLGALPMVAQYQKNITKTAEARGYIRNWLGRRCYFPDKRFAYRALNYAVAGGCADVMKKGMNELDDFLMERKSKLVWNVHDENWFYMHPDEMHLLPELQNIMQTAYPYKHLPLTCGIKWSTKSLADMEKWNGTQAA